MPFIYLLFILITIPLNARNAPLDTSPKYPYNLAVIIDPIVDTSTSFPAPANPPASPQANKCRRAHQGLFNELVFLLEEHENQAKIAFPNVVYGFDAATQKPLNTFWVHKKHIMPLNKLKNNLAQIIPSPQYANGDIIVLIYPWNKFSVGTRFAHLPELDSQSHYAIMRVDYLTQEEIIEFVPHENAILETQHDSQSARKLFIEIINNLLDRVSSNGADVVVPYIWGGSSFVQPYSKFDFYQEDGVWQRRGKNDTYTGYDCSEFVMRMAQIAGIYFPWKTTRVIGQSLRSLNNEDHLEDGDLIWVEGHVMIISNIQQNEIIEMCGYSSGYGCLQRFQLSERFNGILSFADLVNIYNKNEPITFKNKQGKLVQTSNGVKLLKLVD